MKRALLVVAFVAADAFAAGGGSVFGSKHDLSISGPGPIKAVRERNPCIFCHVSHGGGKRLSNRPDPTAPYRPYESGTIRAKPGNPTGSSRVCLSCHDGTIAVGRTRKRLIEMTGTAMGRIPVSRRSNLGTDLRQSHPFSISATASPNVRLSAGHGRVTADEAGLVQCTSCHDPHSEFGGSTEGKFLVEGTARSALCTACHERTVQSSHATSMNRYTVRQPEEAAYQTVADAGCMACHVTHGAAPKGQLLRLGTADPDENVCLRCHGAASGVGIDVGRELTKTSSHAVTTGGRHDASEGPSNPVHRLPEGSVGASRHVTCVDCHNPHEAKRRAVEGQRIGGALDGVWGIDEGGRRIEVSQFEYQICFKCHGDSANQRTAGAGVSLPRRAAADPNLRAVFGASAPSSHPVVSPGRSSDVPSLRPPLTTASLVSCSDCHSSDDGPATRGTGARGPHGSVYRPLLERNYSTADFTIESPDVYALCYKCHDRTVLLSDASAFRLHAKHVVDGRAPCSACHAAHGISTRFGTARHNAHLIDFDLSIVRPNGGLEAPYSSDGPRTGSCAVTCHGRRPDHHPGGIPVRY